MLSDQFASTSHARTTTHDDGREGGDHEEEIREIHALTPPRPPPTNPHYHAHRSSSMSMASTEGASSENNFTTMSREFSALVLAGSSIDHNTNTSMMMNISHDNTMEGPNSNNNLGRIGEEDLMEETNPLAIVPDNHPLDPVPSPRQHGGASNSHNHNRNHNHNSNSSNNHQGEQVSVQRVKKEEVDAKILAWQNAKVAKINNRFKREDAVINGWESEQVQKATSWMNKVERKLEEKRAKALEKMQNEVAKAHRKAEERRASAEAKRGTKVARVLEIAGLMRAVGRPPAKKSFF